MQAAHMLGSPLGPVSAPAENLRTRVPPLPTTAGPALIAKACGTRHAAFLTNLWLVVQQSCHLFDAAPQPDHIN
jgi:hypothetical protein